MVVHLARSSDAVDGPSVGFVVSKAVGNAVVRNRVKRRMRAIVAKHLDDLGGSLVVVRALPASAGVDSQQLEADYLGCVRRIARRTEQR